MSSPTITNNIFESVKGEVNDSRMDKLTFIRKLNILLFRMNLTKPAEVLSNIYFLKDYEKYPKPAGFREPINIYSETIKIIRYVSNFRYQQLKDPTVAYTDQSDNGVRFLKVRNPYSDSIVTVATECDSLTDDGAWTISGGTGLAVDSITKKSGSASLSFTINTAQCTLTFVKSSVIDSSTYTEFLRERFYMWFPSKPTSVVVRVGNDSSNYYEQTLTAQASGEQFSTTQANELELAQESATKTGTIDRDNMDWFQFVINFDTAINVDMFRIDKIVLGKPEIIPLEHYTNYVAISSAGVLLQSITENVDTTDEPIIKDYPDYINTVIDGLSYDYLKVPDPARAQSFYARYLGEKDPNGKYLNGMGYLAMRYPSRRASYKRLRQLPDLDYGLTRMSRSLYDNN
jgi:hypothetical protein